MSFMAPWWSSLTLKGSHIKYDIKKGACLAIRQTTPNYLLHFLVIMIHYFAIESCSHITSLSQALMFPQWFYEEAVCKQADTNATGLHIIHDLQPCGISCQRWWRSCNKFMRLCVCRESKRKSLKVADRCKISSHEPLIDRLEHWRDRESSRYFQECHGLIATNIQIYI